MTPPFTEFSLKDKSAFTAWKIVLVSASSFVHCKSVTSCASLDVEDITLVPSLRPLQELFHIQDVQITMLFHAFLCIIT